MARSYQLSAFGTQVPYRELYKTFTSNSSNNYVVTTEDNNDILVFSLGANTTVNLPPAARAEGMNFKIWNNNSGTFTVTVDPHGLETIDGVSTLVLDVGEGAKCHAIGGRWITDRVNAVDVFSTSVVSGSTKNSIVRYTGTTPTAGAFDGSTSNPTGTTRINYSGNFHANNIFTTSTANVGTNLIVGGNTTISGNVVVASNVSATNIFGDGSGMTIRDKVSVISTNTLAVTTYTYVLLSSLTLTLPASPVPGDYVSLINFSGTTTGTVARNGNNIMGLAEDMAIDVLNASIKLIYVDATRGWLLWT